MKVNYNKYAYKVNQVELFPRMIDFRWYYKAFADLGCGYRTYGKATTFVMWISRTFKVCLLMHYSEPKQPVI